MCLYHRPDKFRARLTNLGTGNGLDLPGETLLASGDGDSDSAAIRLGTTEAPLGQNGPLPLQQRPMRSDDASWDLDRCRPTATDGARCPRRRSVGRTDGRLGGRTDGGQDARSDSFRCVSASGAFHPHFLHPSPLFRRATVTHKESKVAGQTGRIRNIRDER